MLFWQGIILDRTVCENGCWTIHIPTKTANWLQLPIEEAKDYVEKVLYAQGNYQEIYKMD